MYTPCSGGWRYMSGKDGEEGLRLERRGEANPEWVDGR
jgi:hypothetical protein